MGDRRTSQDLDKIVRLMGRLYDRDISMYDQAFLISSLDQRMSVIGCETRLSYFTYLSENATEAAAFHASLSITFSEFFRNPLTFAYLEQVTLPALIAERERGPRTEIRVWSAGCAAGQEPYTIAVILDALTAARQSQVSFRIFATDTSETELAAARRGVYAAATVRNVRLGYLSDYFEEHDGAYAVTSALRGRVSFSVYDLLDEDSLCPPSSIYGGFDLVFCSNLLFYYRPDMQQAILNKLQFCLPAGGYLVTGEAEKGIVARTREFRAVASAIPVYKKTAGSALQPGSNGPRTT